MKRSGIREHRIGYKPPGFIAFHPGYARSKTIEANDAPGLNFIGEVVDVTGQLGGYNFQWAWASGHAAGQAV